MDSKKPTTPFRVLTEGNGCYEKHKDNPLINKVEVKSGGKFIDAEFEQPMCEFCENPLGVIRLKPKNPKQTRE